MNAILSKTVKDPDMLTEEAAPWVYTWYCCDKSEDSCDTAIPLPPDGKV